MTSSGSSPEEPVWLSELLSHLPADQQEDFRRAMAAFARDDGRTPPAKALRSYHDELWAAFKAWESPGTEDPVVAVAACWWVVANRQAHSAVLVVDGGVAIDAAPNIRAAFEHSLAVVWLWREQGTGVLDSLALRWIKDGVEGFRAIRQIEAGAEGLLELVAGMQADDELPSGDIAVAPFKFGWLVGRLGVERLAKLHYRFLSAFCHPTMGPLLPLLRFDPDGMHPSPEPIRPAQVGDPLLWAVQCQCWSGLALDRILEHGLPFRDRLDAIAEAIDLPMAAELFAPEDLS